MDPKEIHCHFEGADRSLGDFLQALVASSAVDLASSCLRWPREIGTERYSKPTCRLLNEL